MNLFSGPLEINFLVMWGLKPGHSFPAEGVHEACHFQYYYYLSLIFMHASTVVLYPLKNQTELTKGVL